MMFSVKSPGVQHREVQRVDGPPGLRVPPSLRLRPGERHQRSSEIFEAQKIFFGVCKGCSLFFQVSDGSVTYTKETVPKKYVAGADRKVPFLYMMYEQVRETYGSTQKRIFKKQINIISRAPLPASTWAWWARPAPLTSSGGAERYFFKKCMRNISGESVGS